VYMSVFSEDVGWLALFVWRSPSGVEQDGKCVKRRVTIRYGVEPGGRLVSPWWKLFMKCCCCGTGFRACPQRPRHRRGRGAARLRRRVARRYMGCATPAKSTRKSFIFEHLKPGISRHRLDADAPSMAPYISSMRWLVCRGRRDGV